MRKIISFALIVTILMCCLPVAFADTAEIDWTSLPTEEIRAIIDDGNRELASRTALVNDYVVVGQCEEAIIYITRRFYVKEVNANEKYVVLEAVFVNNSDRTITIGPNHISLDGWQYKSPVYEEIAAGKMVKSNIPINMADAGYQSEDQINNTELSFEIFDVDDFLRGTVKTDPVNYIRNK